MYPSIATKYSDFEFIYVHKDAELKFEKKFAKEQNALFWRNGRPYKTESKSEEINMANLITISEQMTDSNGREFVKDEKDVF